MNKNILIIIFLFLLPFLVFWQLWTTNPNDQHILIGDIAKGTYPLNYFLGRAIHEGDFPLWNPYVHSGHPVLGEFQNAPFYPPDMIQNLFFKQNMFDFYKVFEIKIIAHLSLAGVFMFLFMKSLGLRTISAIVSSIIYILNQGMLFYIGGYQPMIGAVWLPIISLFLRRYFLTKKLTFSILSGIFLGIAMLSNAAQALYYLCILSAITIIYFIYLQYKQKELGFKVILGWFSVYLIGFGIAFVQLFPLFEFLNYTIRADFKSYLACLGIEATGNQFFRHTIMAYLFPLGAGWYSRYMGIFSLLLIGLGLLYYKHSLKKFFFSMAIFIWIMGAGIYLFLSDILYLFLPGFSSMRGHERILIYQLFYLSIFAGFGMEFLNSKISNEVKRLFLKITQLAIAAGAAVFLLYLVLFLNKQHVTFGSNLLTFDKANQKLWALFLGLITMVILWARLKLKFSIKAINFAIIIFILLDLTAAIKISPATDDYFCPLAYLSEKPDYTYLKELTGYQQAQKAEPSLEEIFEPRSSELFLMHIAQKKRTYGGYLSTGLKRYYEYIAYSGDFVMHPDRLKYVKDFYSDVKKPNLIQIITYPPAFIAERAIIEKDPKKILTMLADPKFDISKQIILEEKPDLIFLEKQKMSAKAPIKNNVRITKFSNNQVEMDAETPLDHAFLFYSDNWYPGWKAYIDGKETKIYRANYTFKAVAIPHGKRTVKFSFQPKSFKIGRIISLLSLAAVGMFFTYDFLKKGNNKK